MLSSSQKHPIGLNSTKQSSALLSGTQWHSAVLRRAQKVSAVLSSPQKIFYGVSSSNKCSAALKSAQQLLKMLSSSQQCSVVLSSTQHKFQKHSAFFKYTQQSSAALRNSAKQGSVVLRKCQVCISSAQQLLRNTAVLFSSQKQPVSLSRAQQCSAVLRNAQ